jgi:hypothetical protein
MHLLRSPLFILLSLFLSHTHALAQSPPATPATLAAQQVLLAVDTAANRVLMLDAQSGAVINANFITDANSAVTYDFQTPRAAIQVNNEIWVSDQSPNINSIYRFDMAGAFVGRIGGNVATGGLSNVRGMRFIDGTVYAVNAGNTNGAPGPAIVRISPDGTLLGSFSTVAAGGTVGNSPWDITPYNGRFLVSDGTSRGLQLYNADGTYFAPFTSSAINNIPAQLFVRANGNVLMAANGSTPSGSFGLYELGPTGTVLKSWTGTPGLGTRGVFELGNGQYLVNEAGGASATRGLGTIDPNGAANNSNFSLILGTVNGGWISVASVPEPSVVVLWMLGLAAVAWRASPSPHPHRRFKIQALPRLHVKRVVPGVDVANGGNAVGLGCMVVAGDLRPQTGVRALAAPRACKADEKLPVLLAQTFFVSGAHRAAGGQAQRAAVRVEGHRQAHQIGQVFDQRGRTVDRPISQRPVT